MANTEILNKCGTYAGYNRHLKRKETPCNNCANARADYKKWYRTTFPEKISESNRNYAKNNREVVRSKNTRWRLSNPEYFQAYGHKRRAKLKAVPHEPYSIPDVLNSYGTQCHLCGLEIDLNNSRGIGTDGWETSLHLDHLVPISKGGEDTLKNIRPAHGLCNSKKHASYRDSF